MVGAGVEYMLSRNVSTGLEGLWYSFDDDQDLTVLRARLTYHLNRSPHESFKDSYLSASIANWSGFYAGANAGVGFGNGKRVDSVKTAGGADGDDRQRGAKGNVNTANPGQFPASEGIDDPGGGGGGAAALISLENDTGVLAARILAIIGRAARGSLASRAMPIGPTSIFATISPRFASALATPSIKCWFTERPA